MGFNCSLHSVGTTLSWMWWNSQTRHCTFRRQRCPWTSRLHLQSSQWLWHFAGTRIITFCKSNFLTHTL